MNLDDVIGLLEGAPWWVKAIVIVLVISSPAWVPRLVPAKKPTRASSPADGHDDPDDEDEDVRELRDTLISVLQKLQRAETQVATLTTSLEAKDAELRQEKAQTATLTRDLGELRREVDRLGGLLEMVIQQRGSMPPPTGL